MQRSKKKKELLNSSHFKFHLHSFVYLSQTGDGEVNFKCGQFINPSNHEKHSQ
jgi:hypothetical protein